MHSTLVYHLQYFSQQKFVHLCWLQIPKLSLKSKAQVVREVMQSDVTSCNPGDGIVEVAQDMLKTRQRRRPVITEGKLVGQVSSSNVLWALMEYSRRKTAQD